MFGANGVLDPNSELHVVIASALFDKLVSGDGSYTQEDTDAIIIETIANNPDLADLVLGGDELNEQFGANFLSA